MVAIDVNFAGAEDKDFTPFPAGEYELALVRANLGKASKNAKNAGADMVSLMFEVTENNENYVGRTVWVNYTHVEASRWLLRSMLRAWGIEPPEEGGVTVDFDMFLGRPFRARVKVTKASKNQETGAEYEPNNAIQKFIPSPELQEVTTG